MERKAALKDVHGPGSSLKLLEPFCASYWVVGNHGFGE